MKETIHIIARSLSKNELNNIRNNSDSLVYFHFNIEKYKLPNRKYQQQLKPEEKKKINYRVMDQILRFSNEKLDGLTVSDILEYQEMNFWFYQRLTVYMAVRNLEYLLMELRLASKKYRLILYSDIPDYILSRHLPNDVALVYKNKKSYSDISKKLSIGFNTLGTIFRYMFGSPGNMRDKHLLIDNARPVKIYNEKYGEKLKGNFVLNKLFEKLDSRFCLLMEPGLPGKRTAKKSEYRKSIQYSVFKLPYISSDIILSRTYTSIKTRKLVNKIRTGLKGNIDSLLKNFKDTEYNLICYLLSGLHQSYRVYIMRYIGFREICQEYTPLSITASDENSPFHKSLLDAAKSLGIRTIGIQHGAIHELHPAYRLTEEEAKKKIAPDLTLLWGKYWRDLLIEKGNYNKSGLKLSGQIRTDTIQDLTKISRENNKDKVILFASQPQRDPSLREKAAVDLFTAASETEAIAVHLKPHPLEKDYLEYYGAIAEKCCLKNLSYVPDGDLYVLINSSDAVYTCFSTVGTEAIYFSKPLIVHDPLDQDIQGYIASGVGHRVRNAGDCKLKLKEIISNTINQDPAAVSEFVSNYAFRIDGRVSERIISEITGES